LNQDFPRIGDVASKKTSEATDRYNCIAWAFGDNTRWWWPIKRRYWPLSFENKTPMDAFIELFDAYGWALTNNRTLEAGQKKIALYASLMDGQPTHAARQLPNGSWTSKLGKDIDLTHQLADLEGPAYGTVVRVFKKPD
jgi:hypothetical protein